MARMAKYATVVYPSNRHPGLGINVVVYAKTKQDAIERAIEVGWSGRPDDARVIVRSVEDIPPSEDGAL